MGVGELERIASQLEVPQVVNLVFGGKTPMVPQAELKRMGFGMVLYLSTGQSTMQTGIPDALRGRAMALWAMMLSASSLPGHLIAGELARSYPVPDVLLVMLVGVSVALVGLARLVVSKAFKHTATASVGA